MKTKQGFNLLQICGEHILLAEGKENIDFSNIISLNETAAFLWQQLTDKEFTPEDMAQLLVENYEVDQETALSDARALAAEWQKAGIVTA